PNRKHGGRGNVRDAGPLGGRGSHGGDDGESEDAVPQSSHDRTPPRSSFPVGVGLARESSRVSDSKGLPAPVPTATPTGSRKLRATTSGMMARGNHARPLVRGGS